MHLQNTEIKIQVVAAVIQRNGKFLLGKRSGHKKSAPGFWCPVSGSIEPGESEQEAIVREVEEEVGLKVKPLEKLATMTTRDQTAEIHWWLVEIISGEAVLKNDEHTELAWVTPGDMSSLEKVFEEDVALFLKIARDFGF